MNRFRVVDTRFRILKGGKIGLAMSIAMVGGIMSLGSTSANAADEYSSTVDRNVNSDPSGFTVYNSSVDSVRVYATYQNSADYYDGSNWQNTVNTYTYNSPDITISAGTNITGEARDTGADNTLMGIYSEHSFGGWDYDVTDLSNSTVSFSGNNDIRGLVGARWVSYSGGGLVPDTIGTINLNDVDVVFHQTVDAHTININAGSNTTNTDDFTFYGDLTTDGDGSFVAGDPGSINFTSAATVKFNGNVTGNIDFQGNNGTVTLAANKVIDGSIDTTGVNGAVIFKGEGTVTGGVGSNGTLKEVRVDGVGNVLFTGTGDAVEIARVDRVNYQAAALIGFNSGLELSTDTSTNAVNAVTFNNHSGTLQINNGDLIGIEGKAVVTTNGNNSGTVTMISGTQNIVGNIGSSGHVIGVLNIGGDNAGGLAGNTDASYSITTSNGDIYATDTMLNNNNNSTTNSSELKMASGYDLYSTVTTDEANKGVLTLEGGDQIVTGSVGATDVRLAEVNSGAITGANSTFQSDVFAVTLNNGAGPTNLNGNFTGTTLHYQADGVVNLANNKTINANITTQTNNTGTLTFVENGTMTAGKDIGVSSLALKLVNVGATDTATASTVTSDNIYAVTTAINNASTLVVRASKGITGNVASEMTGTGTLNLTAGTNFVNGNIGTSSVALGTVTAGTDATTTYLNSVANTTTTTAMSYIDTLQYTGNGTVVLNGTNSANAMGGMKGTVDFGTNVTNTGALQIGDNVDLTTGVNGIQFADANGATMAFNGDSTVTGVVGGNTLGRSTFAEIYAGVNGKTVTFTDDVHVMEGGLNPATFYVSGTGTINFQGNLYGDLVYNADGVVNVSNGKSILVDTIPVAVTTITDGTGTLNYLGSTTLDTDIGTSAAMLKAITFNSASNNVTQNIGHNVYADTVTIGGTSGTTAISLADVTGVYDYAGATTMKEYRGGTAANITADVTLGGDLTIANDTSAINFGKSHVTVGMTSDGTTSGNFDTNGGAISFTVNTNDISSNDAQSTSTDSALVTVTGTLSMDGDEHVHINYVGSLANSGSYTVVNAAGGTTANGTVNTVVAGAYNQNENGNISDNSFSIDTRVATNASGDLIAYADRSGAASGTAYAANQNYVQKSDTVGHFSNNAAVVLGGIAATGNQTGDMVQVIQKMDIDSFGFGNNQANLEVQAKRLAPTANASLSQSAIGANTLTLNTVSNRIADLRGDSVILPRTRVTGMSAGDETAAVKGVWAKVIAATATQEKDGMYDGYKTRSAGLAMGIDREFTSKKIVAGLAFGYTNTDIDQQDFRSGDTADTDSFNLVAYASKNFERAYVEGALSYAKHNTDSTRATAVGRTATADIDADQYTAHISGGYRFNIKDSATVTPFLTLDYTHLAQDGYTETGADAINLKVDEMSTNRTTVGGGLRIGTTVEKGSAVLRPELKLAAYHISGSSNTDITAQYVGGGEKFVTPGTDLSSMMYNVGLGLKAETSKSTSLGVSIDYDRSSDGLFQGYTGQLVARYEF